MKYLLLNYAYFVPTDNPLQKVMVYPYAVQHAYQKKTIIGMLLQQLLIMVDQKCLHKLLKNQ